MAEQHFTLNSRDEVARFEALTDAYSTLNAQSALKHLSLVGAYDYCQTRSDGGKLFAALLDIYLNFLLLYCDMHVVGGTWNRVFLRGELAGKPVLESEAAFFGKMDIHRYNSSFVLRYRALWDKVMGFFVLFFIPNRYEDFAGAKSRRRAFKKMSAEISAFPQDFAEQIDGMLEKFDGKFRTPEIHGTGVLRKWSFATDTITENPSMELIHHWNIINQMMYAIGKLFPGPTPNPDMTLTK